jgi:hypothetical protein
MKRLAISLLAMWIAGIASADSYLLVHTDFADEPDRPKWLALKPLPNFIGYSKGERGLEHYPIDDDTPALIPLRPRIYVVSHLGFSLDQPDDEPPPTFWRRRSRGAGYYRFGNRQVDVRRDTITYFGDFVGAEGYEAIEQRNMTIARACVEFSIRMKLTFVVQDFPPLRVSQSGFGYAGYGQYKPGPLRREFQDVCSLLTNAPIPVQPDQVDD